MELGSPQSGSGPLAAANPVRYFCIIEGMVQARAIGHQALRNLTVGCAGRLQKKAALRPFFDARCEGNYFSFASARSASARSVCSHENAVAFTVLPEASV